MSRDAGIPDEVVYRPKYVMALSQLDRAMAAGVRFSWITADEWYTQKPAFVRGLEERGQRFVLETPRNFALRPHDPGALPETAAKRGDNLCRCSRAMMRQPWQRHYVKDTDKGPMVWEVKFAPCWLPRDDGVAGPCWLIMARNALDPAEVQYFLSNAGGGRAAGGHPACGVRPLAGGTRAAGREERTGALALRGPRLAGGEETPPVDSGQSPVSRAADDAAAGEKTRS